MNLGLTTGANRLHTTDEAHQLFQGLECAGYTIAGYDTTIPRLDVRSLLQDYAPQTVVIQDQREWDGLTADKSQDPAMKFINTEFLSSGNQFVGTVLKDAHSDREYHRTNAKRMGIHFWIVYYHPDIVARQAPFVRRQHLIRTYHSVDPTVVPKFGGFRDNSALLSGARSGAYPMRSRLWLAVGYGETKNIFRLPHPGYGRTECHTPAYLNTLSMYKVAICTSSRWGYALRKIIEATAAGCVVVTDLPKDEVLPEIDGNLIRVDADSSPGRIDNLVAELCASWDEARQCEWAERAMAWYNYQAVGERLAADIETLRRSYS